MKVHKVEMGQYHPLAVCGFLPSFKTKVVPDGEFEWKYVTCKKCLKKKNKLTASKEPGGKKI